MAEIWLSGFLSAAQAQGDSENGRNPAVVSKSMFALYLFTTAYYVPMFPCQG